eukprot:gene4651-4697_t
MQRQIDVQKAANEQARQANARLTSEVHDLKEGLDMVEEKARSELGMVKPNEVRLGPPRTVHTHNAALDQGLRFIHPRAAALAQALQQQITPRTVHIALHHPHLAHTPPAPTPQAESDAVALTLLMGLDQPCPAEERTAQEACDTRLRAALAAAAIPYRVVYGTGEQRTRNALIAIQNIAPKGGPAARLELRKVQRPGL